MAKNPTPVPKSKETPVNADVIAQDFAAVNQLATLQTTATENVMALATQLGYEGALSVGALEDGIRFYQQRTAEACMELGKRLVLLKETSLPGEFKPRLELLGIEYTAATRFMAVATKFAKVATSQLLKMATSQSKVIELLVLDDGEVAELAEGGTVRGMAADDIASMGVRELRATLREARADKEASDKLLSDKNAKIDKLSRHIKKITPDQKLLELQKETTAHMNDALGCVRGQLRAALNAIKDHSEDDHSVFMAGIVGQLQADLTALREEFNLPDTSNAADQALAADVAQWSKSGK
ncbi:MAG: hypothetical protein V4858_08935 [Pseudomonadota bacterium]